MTRGRALAVAAPYTAAQCWALLAVLAQFASPDRISRNPAYEAIGEEKRAMLTSVVGVCLTISQHAA